MVVAEMVELAVLDVASDVVLDDTGPIRCWTTIGTGHEIPDKSWATEVTTVDS